MGSLNNSVECVTKMHFVHTTDVNKLAKSVVGADVVGMGKENLIAKCVVGAHGARMGKKTSL